VAAFLGDPRADLRQLDHLGRAWDRIAPPENRGPAFVSSRFRGSLDLYFENASPGKDKEAATVTEGPVKLNDAPLCRVRDILWMYTGRDVYRMLVERGWSSEEYGKWLVDTLIRALTK
jgi:hypothetical protein